jgi:hypothetical protein
MVANTEAGRSMEEVAEITPTIASTAGDKAVPIEISGKTPLSVDLKSLSTDATKLESRIPLTNDQALAAIQADYGTDTENTIMSKLKSEIALEVQQPAEASPTAIVPEAPEVISASDIDRLVAQLRGLPKNALKQFEKVFNMLPWQIKAGLVAPLVAACVSGQPSPKPEITPPPPISATASPSETPTASPTEAPTPTPTPEPTGFVEKQDGTFTWTTESGVVKDVPAILGFKQVKNTATGQIEYHDAKTGAYEGQFQEFFTVDKEQTGNVVLKPSEVSKLITAKLATFPNKKDKYVAALPLDTRNATKDTNLKLSYYPNGYDGTMPIAHITFSELPVTNIIPNTKQVIIFKNTYEGFIYNWPLRSDVANAYRVIPGKEEYYFVVGGHFEKVSQTNENTDAVFGGKVCDATDFVDISEGAGSDNRPMQGHILTVPNGTDEVPVAVAA